MIDHFSKSEFEAALPAGHWTSAGFQSGEYCYIVSVKEGVNIFVRSSVKSNGHSADTGEDSIRLWLSSDSKGTPLGSKRPTLDCPNPELEKETHQYPADPLAHGSETDPLPLMRRETPRIKSKEGWSE